MLDQSAVPISYAVLNFALAAAMYTLMARFILMIVFDERSAMVIWRVFKQVTDPMMRATAFMTPAVVPNGLVILFAILWIVAFRLFLLLTYLAFGWIKLGGLS